MKLRQIHSELFTTFHQEFDACEFLDWWMSYMKQQTPTKTAKYPLHQSSVTLLILSNISSANN